ncbi:flagellin [Planctomycetales bacterium]|nr:flagellin [Planctomycetales bacterium]
MSGLSVNSVSGTLAAAHQVQRIQASLTDTMTQLSTGLRINSAKDDPAGLIAQELLRSEITASNAAIKNTQLANSMMNVAESGMRQISNLLVEAKRLAVEAANTGAMTPEMVQANQTEMNAILDSIDRFSGMVNWLGDPLLDGSRSAANGGSTIQLGPDVVSGQQINVSIDSTRTHSVGNGSGTLADIRSGGTASLASNPRLADQVISAAISKLASQRGEIGTVQKYVLDPNIQALQDSIVQLTAAKSLIGDTDYALASSNLARDQILMQAAIGALALTNQNRSYAASLLG